jgi:hypothetical protein
MKTQPIAVSARTKLPSVPFAAVLAACGLLLLSLASGSAAPGKPDRDPRVLPPNASLQGQSLGEWMELEHIYAITGAPINDPIYVNQVDVQVGKVMILAGNWGTPRSVTVKAGTFLFLDIDSMWGELYADGSTDDPNGEWFGIPISAWPSMVTSSQTLDGRPVRIDPQDYFISTTWFDQPIPYGETSSWDSVGAVWFQGFGFLIKPLTPGVHTLTSHVEDGFFGLSWDDTWTITVLPEPKQKGK